MSPLLAPSSSHPVRDDLACCDPPPVSSPFPILPDNPRGTSTFFFRYPPRRRLTCMSRPLRVFFFPCHQTPPTSSRKLSLSVLIPSCLQALPWHRSLFLLDRIFLHPPTFFFAMIDRVLIPFSLHCFPFVPLCLPRPPPHGDVCIVFCTVPHFPKPLTPDSFPLSSRFSVFVVPKALLFCLLFPLGFPLFLRQALPLFSLYQGPVSFIANYVLVPPCGEPHSYLSLLRRRWPTLSLSL